MKHIVLFLMTLMCFSIYSNNNFDAVLLIINYNHPHYESIPLLREIYSTYFPNIVFYGPTQHLDVHDIPHHKGYYSYLCIADAMIKNPQYDGYLFLMDDCILNAWKLKNMDISKIWFSELHFFAATQGNAIDIKQGRKATSWSWWHTEWGCESITKAYYEIPNYYKKILQSNWGSTHVVAAFSDMVYIPAHYARGFIEIAYIFGKHKAFLECALPTIISCLNPTKEWEWLPGNSTYAHSWKDFKEKFYFNHPIKLSNKKNRSFVKKIFKKYKKE